MTWFPPLVRRDRRVRLTRRGALAAAAAAALVAGVVIIGAAGSGAADGDARAIAAAASAPSRSAAPPADRLSPADQLLVSAPAPAEAHGADAVVAAVVPRAVRSGSGSGGDPSAGGASGPEAEVLALTNAQRSANGCGPLALSGTLTAAARAHSSDMATNGYFSHTSADGRTMGDRVTAAGYAWGGLGENIAAGQSTAQQVVDGWMASPGHRANILNCAFTDLGVGMASSPGSPYGTYWTQDFGTPR